MYHSPYIERHDPRGGGFLIPFLTGIAITAPLWFNQGPQFYPVPYPYPFPYFYPPQFGANAQASTNVYFNMQPY